MSILSYAALLQMVFLAMRWTGKGYAAKWGWGLILAPTWVVGAMLLVILAGIAVLS